MSSQYDDALETVLDAARQFAQVLADDGDKSPEDAAAEAAIWDALELLQKPTPKLERLAAAYVIDRTPAKYPAVADTFTVVYVTRQNVSHHESVGAARAEIKKLEAADAARPES
jgi:hypothetical protein